MTTANSTRRLSHEADSAALRWGWIGAGVLIGSISISLAMSVVRFSDQPAIAGFVILLSVVLAGVLVGFYSRGETIRETAVAALVLVLTTGMISTLILEITIPTFVWLVSPFLVPGVAMLGGWTGEVLQGTLEEAYEDRVVDWPWVFVSIVLGFTVSAYAVLLGRELFGVTLEGSLWLFAGSFLITGWLVGFFSPGNTMVEPAIAGALMIVIDAGFILLWFDGIPGTRILLIGFGAGMALALAGGALGELTQRLKERRSSGSPPTR